MNLKSLLQIYLIDCDPVAMRFIYSEDVLKAFADWADSKGYEIIRQIKGNHSAIFCARCNRLIESQNGIDPSDS